MCNTSMRPPQLDGVLWQLDPKHVVNDVFFNYTGHEVEIGLWRNRSDISAFFKGLYQTKCYPTSSDSYDSFSVQVTLDDFKLLETEICNQTLDRANSHFNFHHRVFIEKDLDFIDRAKIALLDGCAVFYVQCGRCN